MYKFGNLCFVSLAVCVMATAFAQTVVSQLSNGDPLNSSDTDDENFADVAVDKARLKPFLDGNQKNQKNNIDGIGNDGDKRFEIASKDDILSINKTLENIQKDTGIAMDEVKKMRDRLNRLEKSMSTSSECSTYGPMRFNSLFYGRNVEFSSDFRTATKPKPENDDGGMGGVVSDRPLHVDEMFKIKIEGTADKKVEGGISIGVIRYPGGEILTSDIFQQIEGTWAIYGNDDSSSQTYIDGRRMDGNDYPLPLYNLSFGTIIGVSRRHNGSIHFHLNGVDKGIAFKNVPKCVYAFVDIMNYVSKIRVVN